MNMIIIDGDVFEYDVLSFYDFYVSHYINSIDLEMFKLILRTISNDIFMEFFIYEGRF